MYNAGVGRIVGGVDTSNSRADAVDAITELELRDSFEDALRRDATSIKKEMGREGLKEIRRNVKRYENDPYMLNVRVQDMSDTLILRAFGRVREGAKGGK